MSVSASAFASSVNVERRVEHDAFGPFMIRMDPDVDLLITRNVRTRRNRHGTTPVDGKQRCEQKASHPSEILKQRHRYTPSTPVSR
jgi:hypothetical protein